MHLTVEEALTIYPLSKAKLAAGSKGTSRVIRSLNTMDAPDVFNWIKPGEMLFTTAFAIKGTPDNFLLMLKKLDERGAAGIGIKLGRYWKEIPEAVLEEADRMDFPILELPYEFTFSDQMNALFQAVFKRSTQKLHDALEKQKQLVRLALQVQPPANLFQTVADILVHPIDVISARGQVLFSNAKWPEKALLKHWPWNPVFHKNKTERGWVFRIPLLQDSDCYGFLLVSSSDENVLQEEKGLFYQAAEILSHHMDLYEDQQSIARHQWDTLIERFLRRQVSKEAFQEQAAAIGTPVLADSIISVLTLPSGEPDTPQTQKQLQDFRREMKYHLRLGMLESQQHVVFGQHLLTIFKVSEDANSNEAFMNMVAQCLEEVHSALPDKQLRSYISKVKPELTDVAEAYEECIEAKKAAESLSFHAAVVPFADLEFAYLFRHIPADVMRKYCDNLLRPLATKDNEYQSYMLKTLESYFANEGQVNEVAKQLFIHRNTVLYRLEKVSELLGLDLRKMSDLMKLKLLFMFQRLMTTRRDSP